MLNQFSVEIGSGRIVEVAEGGDSRGKPVFALHGSPGSRLLYPPHVEDAKKRSIRLIGFNRPGYGGSTRWVGHAIGDIASVVKGVADKMGIEKFGVWGHSGGGNHALGCAANLTDRVVGAASLSTLGPYNAEGLDFFGGMGEYNVEDFKLMMTDPAAWEKKSREDTQVLTKQTKADRMQMMASLLSDVDRPYVTDELDEYLHQQTIEAVRVSDGGWTDDSLASVKPWGFEPSSIRVPVQIWHGRHDLFVPYSHGEWLAAHTSNAEAHLEEGDGHVSIFVNRIPEVQKWLASKF